jgi:hypothetical protein
MKHLAWLSACLVASACSSHPAANVPSKKSVQVVEGFAAPECALYDAAADVYLVSNLSGDPFTKDHNGFVSRVTPDGRVASLRFIDGAKTADGLSSPKGMALVDRTLYVSDIDVVRTFDADSGAPREVIAVPGAVFLNDVAAGPDGTVYVTDTGLRALDEPSSGADAIFALHDGQVRVVAHSKALGIPNGVVWRDGHLEVVTWGTGEWLTVDLQGAVRARTKVPAKTLDGVVALDDGTLLISSWETSSVYRLDAAGKATVLLSSLEAPADIGFDTKRRRVLVPQMTTNRLTIAEL